MRPIIICFLMLTSFVSYAETNKPGPIYPTSNKWIERWSVLLSSPLIDPRLNNAIISLPVRNVYSDQIEEGYYAVQLLDTNGKEIGLLEVDKNWERFLGFSLYPENSAQPIGIDTPHAISINNAQEIATKFAHSALQQKIGDEHIIAPEYIAPNGIFQFSISYRYRDIDIRKLLIDINYKGYVSQFIDGFPARSALF